MNKAFEHHHTETDERPVIKSDEGREQLWVAGGLFGALLASTCCIAPFVFVTLGVSGAWIGNLTALEPYKPYFLTGAGVLLSLGFWQLYIKPRKACTEGEFCARPGAPILSKTILWVATGLVVLSATVNFWAPYLY